MGPSRRVVRPPNTIARDFGRESVERKEGRKEREKEGRRERRGEKVCKRQEYTGHLGKNACRVINAPRYARSL